MLDLSHVRALDLALLVFTARLGWAAAGAVAHLVAVAAGARRRDG